MESRGKRLVSMIKKRPDSEDIGFYDGPSTSGLNKPQYDVDWQMENMFDSDDSLKDPHYEPITTYQKTGELLDTDDEDDSFMRCKESYVASDKVNDVCSHKSDIFTRKSDKRSIVIEIERIFDIDEDCLQNKNSADQPGASSRHDDNIILNDIRSNDEDENEGIGLVRKDSHAIAVSVLDLLLKRVLSSKALRKRWMKPNPSGWKINIGKKRRSDGLPYEMKNKQRCAKVPKAIDCSKCRFKCNLSEEERQELCRHYWNLNYVGQKNFILNNVAVEPPKKVLAVRGCKKQRKFTTKCFLHHQGVKQQVCQKFFCATLAISSVVINDAIEKRNASGFYNAEDKRGKKEPPNKTSEAAVIFVRKHIESFPHMEPHYIRKTSKRLYLDSSLSIAKMYQLYKLKCNKESVTPVSEITYRRIFGNDYNFSFFVPKKDQCLLCSNYSKATPEKKRAMKEEYDEHIARKETCNKEKLKDKERSAKEDHFCCVTFDLQAVLQIPSGLVGQLYYCRKLCVYNFCMYEAAQPNNAYCFPWSEVNGKRGSAEIGSILYYYLTKCLPTNITEVCLYSDTCGGQNRNQFVASLLLFAVNNIEHVQMIEHKFLESGHSYMEVDSMHSSIESAKKNTEIFCMPDYISIFKRARSTKTTEVDGKKHTKLPFKTKEFKFNEFYDLKKLSDDTKLNRTKDNKGNQVKWLKIKRMRYLKSEPSKIFFNYNMSEEFLFMETQQTWATTRPKRRKDNSSDVQTTPALQLQQLYQIPLSITEAKKKDLLGLCSKNIIPEEYHAWFASLSSFHGADRLPEPSVEEESSEE